MKTYNYNIDFPNLYDRPHLECPECGDDYIHPVGLECRSPGTETGQVTIDSNGIAIDPHARPTGRGVRIVLRFVGECGHEFDYIFYFHKFSTYVSCFMGLESTDDEQCPETIRRD